MSQPIYQIYDKIFKKILTLSSTAVINLINGLFDTNHPTDSTIQYNWTEFEDDKLKRILADTIITVNHRQSYHMEAQMTKDEDIIFRVFEYGFSHANRNSIKEYDHYVLPFPEPKIIYLSSANNVPDEYTLILDFGTQGTFHYKASTFKYTEKTLVELEQRKMIILIPFRLLKMRKVMEKERSQKNLEALKSLIQNDIIQSIDENCRVGNITVYDALRLKRLTHQLYEQIYSHYDEMEDMNNMTDESLMLDIDIVEKEYEEKLAQKDEALTQKDAQLTQKDEELAQKDEQIIQKDEQIAALKAQHNEEIIALKKQIAQLQKENM